MIWASLFEWYQRDKGKDNGIYTSGPGWYAGYITLIPSLEDEKLNQRPHESLAHVKTG